MGELPKIYTYSNIDTDHVTKVLVIGCGGTGAYTIAFLSRIISTLRSEIEFCIADGDIVEEKNLLRQHFIQSDVGKNKAEVLSERYSSAFGIPIKAISEEINSTEKMQALVGGTGGSTIIIGCVDNNASRKIIRDVFVKDVYYSQYWIDSGNEEFNGQVVLGTQPSYSTWRIGSIAHMHKNLTGALSLPHVLELYPDMEKEDKFNSEISCAERSLSAPQNMMTNVTAATLIANFAQKIIFKEGIKTHAVEFTINNVFTTQLNTKENLSKVNFNRRPSWERPHWISLTCD